VTADHRLVVTFPAGELVPGFVPKAGFLGTATLTA
jgi:hypothetical protein